MLSDSGFMKFIAEKVKEKDMALNSASIVLKKITISYGDKIKESDHVLINAVLAEIEKARNGG